MKEYLRKVSRVLKKTLPSGVSIRQHISVKKWEKGEKKRTKKKTGRQKLTSLPATDSRSLQNEKRKLVFVGPPPKDDDDGGLL
jgi:hypothetical protein